MQKNLTLILLFIASIAYAQKRPLDHSVYDTWESVGLKQLSNNGEWAAFSILQQEGDSKIFLNGLNDNSKKTFPRGASLKFSSDSKYAAYLIKPAYKDTRLAKIKKKKSDEMIKDSLGVINLTTMAVTKVPRIKSFLLPENGNALLAYQLEKTLDTGKKVIPAAGLRDKNVVVFADEEDGNKKDKQEGTELVFKNLVTGIERRFKYVNEYAFNKNGKQLAISCTGSKKDKTAPVGVFLLNTEKGTLKTLVSNKGNYKKFVFDDDGEHLAFLGESSPEKNEIKDFNIYYNSLSLDTAQILVENDFPGMPSKWAISGNGELTFSKDGGKLFFGIAPVKTPKDTTIVDFEHAKLDVWGYKDDYLQPMQLKNSEKEINRTYLAAIDIYNNDPKIIPLADVKVPDATIVNEGSADFVLSSSNYGNRIELQWTSQDKRDYYLSDLKTGVKRKILTGIVGYTKPSPAGNYIIYFDDKTSGWYTYNISTGKIVHLNNDLNVKFADELNDSPGDPSEYGLAGWTEDDKAVMIYDRYDIWSFSPDGKGAAKNLTKGFGRQNNITLRYESTDPEARFIRKKEEMWLSAFNNITKENGFYRKNVSDDKNPQLVVLAPFKYSSLIKAKQADRFIFDKGNYTNSPNVYVSEDMKTETKLSSTNPQQQNYNWGNAELVKWTTPKGFASEGILYKPENFDPEKKYPMIVYFYEKLSSGLYAYNAPAPTPSRLNISFFVSNGYLVFAPDISYEKGYPGQSAMEFINSGVESLKKNKWVDGTKIGLQGQSWGGYQIAYLVTRTDMYAAAWAGAPVANMTSAYGGIRWESGMSRQFQYEKTQSRIGATLWEKPELYIENSPLFSLPKVNTPLVIMSNDADGAVPWYQGIELFTGLKRLGKPAWLLNYNNEAHNLVLRQNRKDIQIREQQFFDYYLKGAKAPLWMVNGIPAIEKGRTWGFELTDEKP